MTLRLPGSFPCGGTAASAPTAANCAKAEPMGSKRKTKTLKMRHANDRRCKNGDGNRGMEGLSLRRSGGKGEVEDHLMRIRAAPLPGLNHSGGVSTISFQTEAEVNYVIEYSDSLTTPRWDVLARMAGSGNVAAVTDNITRPMRFYRIRFE